MTRRSFFRTLALAAAWTQTQHLTWAFPKPVHVIPQRFLYARIRVPLPVAPDWKGAFARAAQEEWAAMARDIERYFERGTPRMTQLIRLDDRAKALQALFTEPVHHDPRPTR